MPKERKTSNNDNSFYLTHPERILYPGADITKRELAEYYMQIQDWILPYIAKRPLTLVRCPQGISHACFYQKHISEHQDDYLYPIEIKESEGVGIYSYLKDIKGIVSLVQMGVLEIHIWGSHVPNFEKPDMITFDLDPAPEVSWNRMIKAANFLRENLEAIKLKSFVKTTGGKGLHVVVPITPKKSWDEIKEFTHSFVESMVAVQPKEFVANMSKLKRKNKIFIDYLRNQRGATSIAPYSTRAKKDAPVSTPIGWNELTSKLRPDTYNIRNIVERLSRLKNDPWEEFVHIKQSVKF